ncbi:MAG TPA: TIGR02206 family membrane protein [Thermoanaerobaculia bacterium]|jgi:hypothetical integral membrane protein (TIGR02206 family)|nr:TIGR02206 family membrane protein [Thermoanaerobaculia bacterium]
MATPSAPRFVLFGPAHLTVLFLTFALPMFLAWLVRRPGGDRLAKPIAWTFAAVLLLDQIVMTIWGMGPGMNLKDNLPLHLCDWATFTCVAALIWRHRLSYELTYFWGLAGTLQAVITPDLEVGFPDPGFFAFHIAHAGLIAAVLFLTLGLAMRPYPRSLVRAFLWLQLYAVVTAILNLLLDTNYGYLRRKPALPSLLDYLGPWPVYLVSLEALALTLFLLCYLPFAVADWMRRRGGGVGISAAC